MNKYQLIKDNFIHYKNTTLYRIRSLIDFGDIKAGDIGGYIESESNLSHEGNCWVYNTARVLKNARIYDNARVYNNSVITGNAHVFENAQILDNSHVRFNSKIHGNAKVINNSIISGDADISGDIIIRGNTCIGTGAILNKNKDYITIDGLYTITNPITFYRTKDNNIGCIDSINEYLTIESYMEQIKSSKQILMVDLIKRHFDYRGTSNEL